MSKPEPAKIPAEHGSAIDQRDSVRLLRLMADVVSHRADPRAWRLELLKQLLTVLCADVAAALIVKQSASDPCPSVAGIFEAGFKSTEHRQAFLQEFNIAPLQDPVSRHVMEQIARAPASTSTTFTAARSSVLDANAWNDSPHIQQFRQPAGLDDCIVSAHRRALANPEVCTTMMLYVLRSPGAAPFTPRQALLLDTLHAGLSWMYQFEEANQRLGRASPLSRRLRQTLECLLAGDTERQVASKLNISAHTVHDYVKALYLHFGVSSRSELLARWIQSGGGQPPAKS